MKHDSLTTLHQSPQVSLYTFDPSGPIKKFIGTTSESRAICNDPLIFGVEYTEKLKTACTSILKALHANNSFDFKEDQTSVLHILRGGLNFGLRDSLHQAFGWNRHGSAFVSAQRTQDSKDPSRWFIVEDYYNKFELSGDCGFIFGDVVATGTSLEHGLQKIYETAKESGHQVLGLLFFTIGGENTEIIIDKFNTLFLKEFSKFKGSSIVYLEGRFGIAHDESPLTIKLPGTDLLRSPALLAPEFIESQNESASYPIERCTIYDAGSRASSIKQYLEDVLEYWTQVEEVAKTGILYEKYLAERAPFLSTKKTDTCLADTAKLIQNKLGKLLSKY